MIDLIPAIDLRGGQVVRLLQGDYRHQTTYRLDPLRQALDFQDAGARWLHLVDLDGARSGRLDHIGQVSAICSRTSLKVECGGGIRDEAAVKKLLAAGARRVVLGTAVLENWSWFESLVHQGPYHERICLGLDARDGRVAARGWEQQTEARAVDLARRVRSWPLAAIIYTDIATDGTMSGPNFKAIGQMIEAADVPLIASGGIGQLADLRALGQLPLAGVIVGRALYEKAFTLPEALEVLQPFQGPGSAASGPGT